MAIAKQSKYKPEYCAKVVECMKEGMSVQELALEIGVNKVTLYNWAKSHPEFDEALEDGRWFSEGWWHRLGRLGAAGEVQINAKVWDTNMHNRFKWKNHRSFEHSGPDGGPIKTESKLDLDDLTEEQLAELFEQKTGLRPPGRGGTSA